MDSSIEAIKIKDEVIESVDVPIQDGTKSAIDIIVKKELMDSSEVEVIQGQSRQTGFFELALRDRNMQVRFSRKVFSKFTKELEIFTKWTVDGTQYTFHENWLH